MRARRPAWRGISTLWAVLWLALALAAAPAVEAVKHGPAIMVAEADHRACHAEYGHSNDIAGADHHDPSENDHVGAALLASPGAEMPPPPERTLRPNALVADETIRDGPRRPPRPTVI